MKEHPVGELRTQFWEIMKLNCKGRDFRAITCISAENLQKKFQLFEVLVVESLNRIDPALKWTVTQVSGDQGVDFRGSGPSCEFSFLNLTIHQTLIGQTKRRIARDVELFDNDLKKIGKLAQSENISGVLFVFSSEYLSVEALYEHFREPDNSIFFRGAKYFIDARRFEDFWARDRTHILTTLDQCLTDDQKQVVDDYLASIVHTSQVRLDVDLDSAVIGQTGKRFRCRLRLSQRAPLPNLKVRLRYQPDPSEASKVEVLLPSRLAGTGHELVLSGDGITEFEFFLRCFVAGSRRLGKILIETQAGVLIDAVELGERNFLQTFEPPYFEKPNRTFHKVATQHLADSANGAVHALAVLGAGGAGKSRFCEAILEEAADLGFDWLSIGHDNSINARRRLIRTLITNLLPTTTHIQPHEQLIQWLQGRISPFDETHARALKTYFEEDSENVPADIVTAALLTLIIERIKYRPLFIHLRDLHWADGDTLSILGNTIDALRNACQTPRGALFLLEGRDRDSLRIQTGLFRPPEDWLAFLDARSYDRLEIAPWTVAQSKDFLEDMIEAARNPSEGVQAQVLPLFKQLCDHILAASSGNPMHLIEQLKSLIDNEYIEVTDTGTIYLKRYLPTDWRAPKTIEELIRLRLEFLKVRAPHALELLLVMAKIGPRIPGALFRFVQNHAGTSAVPVSELYGVDMVSIPQHDGESFKFQHENYYQVCRNTEIRGDAFYLTAAIDFYHSQDSLAAKQQFEVAFLMAHHKHPDYQKLVRHIRHGMEEAKQDGDDLLCLDFCKFLLNLPQNIIKESGIDAAEIKLEQGIRQKFSGSWEESLESLLTAESMFAMRPLTEEVIMRRLFCKADIVNALVTLMRTDEALAEVEEGLRLIEGSRALGSEGDTDFTRKLIEARDRLWHRRAVSLWFDGDIAQAAKWQRRAYISGRAQQNAITVGKTLREFGTLILHRNPLFGRRLLNRALEQLKEDNHHEAALLTQVEMLFADLLLANWVDRDVSRAAVIREQATRLHFICQEKASMYEAALAGLVTGSCCALSANLEDANHWFRLVITIAMRTRAYDEIWKARLNLGQICLELGLGAEAKVHSTEAAETILIGLDAGSWAKRTARRAMMTWPLLQCIRAAPELEARLSPYLLHDVSLLRGQWEMRPPAVSKSGQPAQVLHVRRDESDYYLHN